MKYLEDYPRTWLNVLGSPPIYKPCSWPFGRGTIVNRIFLGDLLTNTNHGLVHSGMILHVVSERYTLSPDIQTPGEELFFWPAKIIPKNHADKSKLNRYGWMSRVSSICLWLCLSHVLFFLGHPQITKHVNPRRWFHSDFC